MKCSLAKLILFGACLGIASMVIGVMINLGITPFNLYTLIAPLIVLMFGIGFMVPTGSSGAMAPFPKLAGSESALLCAFMFGCASILTAIGSHLNITAPIPLFLLLGSTCVVALLLLSLAKKGEKHD